MNVCRFVKSLFYDDLGPYAHTVQLGFLLYCAAVWVVLDLIFV